MEKINLSELILNYMPTNTNIQKRIKLYIQMHKNNCNDFLYNRFCNETTILNSLLKSLCADLCYEISNVFLDSDFS